jgi:uncharacterized membrane protein
MTTFAGTAGAATGVGGTAGFAAAGFMELLFFLAINLQTRFWRFARGKPPAREPAERTSEDTSARFPGVNAEVEKVTLSGPSVRWIDSGHGPFTLVALMSDPAAPSSLPPEQPSGPSASASTAQPAPTAEPTAAPAPEGTGLQPNLAACLACIFSILGGIAFLALEKKNAYVRFYAMQSAILGGLWVVVCIVFTIVYAIIGAVFGLGLLLALIMKLTYLAFLALTLYTAFKAFSYKEWEIPYLGKIARDQLAGKPPQVP